jgi:predicted dehydrogenase
MRLVENPILNRAHTIGIVGAGGIVKTAHLPAYKNAGFDVCAIYDKDRSRAEALALEFGIPKVCHSLDEILKDSSLEIIDIAVPPAVQSLVVRQAVRERKHLLCQKPLARSATEAKILVEVAEAAAVKLAVNVSMRWGPANREVAELVRDGAIGQIRSVLYDVKYYEDWTVWPWLLHSDRLLILLDMIHILDFTRTLMGEPLAVEARYGRAPDSDVAGETWADVRLRYGNQVIVRYDEDCRIPTEQTAARFRVTGTQASVVGTFGVYYNLPIGKADTLKLIPNGVEESTVPEPELPGRWVPDSFSETMRSLMLAIENNSEPWNSGRDHIQTLALIESVYSAGKMELLSHRPSMDEI